MIRVAVIGVGHLGQHHARILSELPGARLVGIVDVDRGRAEAIAAQRGTQAFTEVSALFGQVDAVTIAVPTVSHLTAAAPFLERGVPVLVEKPLAQSLAEADAMIALAASRGATLAVGHTERFNPAIEVARAHVTSPRFLEVHRLGVFPERSLDIDVVFDLMIHDLDVILSMPVGEIVAIEAVGVAVLTGRTDIANARLRFSSGCIANLTASRISRDRVRKIRFFQPDSYLSIDYAAQELEMWRLVRVNGQRPNIEGGAVAVPREEPLKRELADFLAAVECGRPPLVTGRQGRAALALATEIASRMETVA